jgi:hypothetical protein
MQMSTPNITRAQVDRAETLDFEAKRTARADLTITVKARVAGFDAEICYLGSIEQLAGLVKRLQELGAEPVSTVRNSLMVAPEQPARKPAAKVAPVYDGDGDATCPTHGTKLREGKWGLFCPTKDRDTAEYCKLKFAE